MQPEPFRLRVRGATGSILLGPATAATLGPWSIWNARGVWHLSASAVRVDPFLIRQSRLGFTAPRPHGFWFWPVVSITVSGQSVRATLNSPEQ